MGTEKIDILIRRYDTYTLSSFDFNYYFFEFLLYTTLTKNGEPTKETELLFFLAIEHRLLT